MRLNLKRLCEIGKHNPNLMALVLVLTLMLWLNLRRPSFDFYWDSMYYWYIKDLFETNGHFSILTYNDPLRGYLFPLICYVISKTAIFLGLLDTMFLVLVQTVVFCGVITFIIPGIVESLFNRKPNFIQIMFFAFWVIYFWYGYFLYPLTDFWSLSFLIMGIYFVSSKEPRWWRMILAGIFWGGMVIIRPSYQIALLPLTLWGLFRLSALLRQRNKLLLALLIFTLSLGTILLPQHAINRANFQTNSPFVTAKMPGGLNLFMGQLMGGILIQKRETSVGSSYPTPGALFLDIHGRNILVVSEYQDASSKFVSIKKTMTLKDYLTLVMNYPVDFLLIYVRHLFNGLDIVYNTPYIYDIYQNSLHLRLVNYSLWFFTLFWLRKQLNISNFFTLNTFLLAIFIIPAISTIPGGIEIRFMLPLHLSIYGIASFFIIPEIFSSPLDKIKVILIEQSGWYLLFLLICLLLSANTYASLEHGQYVLR